MIHVQYTEKKNTKGDNGTMADTNEEHTQIDEDEPQIDEDQVWIENKRMREFERRNGVSVNECCGRRDGFLIRILHFK